ncbi:MAG: Rid family detoxifying hydrolase [Bacillota bacterium]|nr:Rid family detoxifying hydrolase [Bacillota bacterium]
MIRAIHSDKAPAAVGPYSQAITNGKAVFLSGQLPIKDGVLETEIRQATRNCIENAKAILEEAGLSLSNVMKTTVFLKDIADFAAMNEVYGEYFSEHKPARSAFQVAALPLGAVVEIEFIADASQAVDF